MLSETVKTDDISQTGVIGDQNVSRLFFDVVESRECDVPQGVDSDDGLAPEIGNPVAQFPISIKGLQEGYQQEYD